MIKKKQSSTISDSSEQKNKINESSVGLNTTHGTHFTTNHSYLEGCTSRLNIVQVKMKLKVLKLIVKTI